MSHTTSVWQAIEHCNVKQIQELLQQNPVDLNVPAENGEIVLLQALMERVDSTIIECLIENGADVNVTERHSGRMSLHQSAKVADDIDIVQLLIRNGANVNAIDDRNSSPLHWAVNYKRVRTTQCLLEWGCDVSTVDIEGRTCLHGAITWKHFDVVRLLVQEWDADIGMRECTSTIDWAIQQHHPEILRFLVANDCSHTRIDEL
eukprot:NODE_463_length_819_cov_479.130058_g454_i0.p1 GENE.NODE_463_length_819_cov_479.130058_g454_i0~~NODE_463_length_819_cov_479.130058_g454_i0.p1  ORF type:complete len:204 (+),score=31.49 NODE_463_length_819_cov_479.130058_g454_i0:75-686(+)